MNFKLPELNVDIFKDKAWWADAVFYFMLSVLAVVVACYVVIFTKSFYQNKKVLEIEAQIATYNTAEKKSQEKKVFEYKSKFDDFAKLLNNHKINSSAFAFIEKNTLPSISFTNFNMAGLSGEMRMSGEAPNLEILSRQFKAFETNREYVKSIGVLNSQTTSSGSITFVWNVLLEPKVFDYAVPEVKIEALENIETITQPNAPILTP